jgi:hypothetical protein
MLVKNRIFPLFLWLFALSLTAPSLYARGKQDQSLRMADTLIAEKQYDDAILILSDFARKHPERFGESQQRLQQIYKIREEYNYIADELIDEVISDAPDMERVLSLTNRLEELESSSKPQVRQFIERVRELAMFNHNRQRLAQILEQGRAQIDRGDFEGALLTYAGGMDIYQDDFFASGYGEIIEQRVRQRIGNISNVPAAFSHAAAPLRTAAADMAQAADQGLPPARMGELYNHLSGEMDVFINLQRQLYEAADYFDRQLSELQRMDSVYGDRSFLSFASRLLRGRSGESVPEGMLGVLEGYWNSAAAAAETSLQNRTDAGYNAGLSAALNREYQASQRNFILTREYKLYPQNLIIKRRMLKEQGGLALVEINDQTVLRENMELFLKYESMDGAVQLLLQGCDLGAIYESSVQPGERNSVESWRGGTLAAAVALRREQELQDTLGNLGRDIDNLISQLNQKEIDLRGFQEEIDANSEQKPNILVYINNARTVIGGLRSGVTRDQLQSSVRYYTIANGELEKRLAGRREQFTGARSQINGIRRVTQDRGEVLDRFPSEGLAVITAMINAITADTEEGTALLSRYARDPREIAADQTVTALHNSARSMMNEFSSLRSQGQNLLAPTRNQIAEADAYRQDGVRYYREAQNALGRQNFDIARDRVTRAAEQFNASLAIQESAALRNEWDTQLFVLGQEINRLENDMVIRDVRRMVIDARAAYFQGSFERAEDLLVRAQNRWHVTNRENDEEVDYWLNIVRGAVSLRSGRTIPVTAPLYPEMSQLLSEAKKSYEEGIRLLDSGRRSEGIARFNDARQKTRDVKLMFPVNQEAGMLDLRMDQVVDPRAFDSGFEQRLRTAIAGTERRSIEAFAELQNLAEINPRYPGLAGILNRAEIAMGIRPPPPDPRAIARSNELSASAQRILDTNNTAQFEVALAQINEAIILNPTNNQATVVKDRLLTRISNSNALVMSSQDEAAYSQALREYQQGNYIMSLAIVQRLLQNPQYRNISKLLELQRRVQAYL